MKKISILLTATCLMVFVLNCSGVTYRSYTGPQKDKSQISFLYSGAGTFSNVFPILHTFDGVEGKSNFHRDKTNRKAYNSQWDGSFCIEMLPGKHLITVTPIIYSQTQIQWRKKPLVMEFDSEAGKDYYLNVYQLNGDVISRVELIKKN